MSHVAKYTTTIKNPHLNLVVSALELAAEDLKGKVAVKSKVFDYIGKNGKMCDYVLTTDRLCYGVGINVGETLSFEGDGYVEGWHNAQNRIIQHYGVLATRAAAASKGFTFIESVEVDRPNKQKAIRIELEVA